MRVFLRCSSGCARGSAPTLTWRPYCTFAVTEAFAFRLSVQVFELPEHAPLQVALRPFDTVSVTAVPLLNDADPLLPTATLMPAGLDVIV